MSPSKPGSNGIKTNTRKFSFSLKIIYFLYYLNSPMCPNDTVTENSANFCKKKDLKNPKNEFTIVHVGTVDHGHKELVLDVHVVPGVGNQCQVCLLDAVLRLVNQR